MLFWLKDNISSSEASTPRTPSQDIALEDLSGPKEATPNKPNSELLNEESESRDPEHISEEKPGTEEAEQRPPNLEQFQATLQEWKSYEEQLNENPGPREASLPNPRRDGDLHERKGLRKAYRKYLRTRSNIETIEEQLRARGILWMVLLPLDWFEPQAGLPEAAAELKPLKKLIVVQRIDLMQCAERWVSKQNVVRIEH